MTNTDKNFQARLFAALLGKYLHEWENPKIFNYICKNCGIVYGREQEREYCPAWNNNDWSPSINGEITQEVRQEFARILPDWWEKYLEYVAHQCCHNPEFDSFSGQLTAQLSIDNLTKYILANWREMFMGECPCPPEFKGDKEIKRVCPYCNGTGYIVKKGFEKVVEVIREQEEIKILAKQIMKEEK